MKGIEERISKLENKTMRWSDLNNREKINWENKSKEPQGPSICIMWVLQGEEKEGRAKRVLEEIKVENSNLAQDVNLQIQEAEKNLNWDNPKKIHATTHYN